jgi:flavin-dependent dehydrogenase
LSVSAPVDAVVIGGGPAGAAAGRLLAAWGHSVVILDNPTLPARGLAESIPPSTRKLLAEIGVLDDVERAAFFRGRGNTVWWASPEPRIESFRPPWLGASHASFGGTSLLGGFDPSFGAASAAYGYQVFRPDFDRVLLTAAIAAGARAQTPARVSSVTFGSEHATIDYDHDGQPSTIEARLVLDCSGRAGVVARRFRRVQPGHRTYALVGVWERERWDFPDDTHTAVETFDDGWAWSVPISATRRHVGVMAQPSLNATRLSFGAASQRQRYCEAIAKTLALRERLAGATLQHEWACDASMYFSESYATPQCLLVGDAGSFIDPLSSFGVKKALASAWLAAVAGHTALASPDRRGVAFDYFSNWERGVYTTHLWRSREFARAARQRHAGAFWASRAELAIDAPPDGEDEIATARFDPSSSLNLQYAADVSFEDQPVVRGREIVLEKAFSGGMRFARHVDLVQLAEMACQHHRVPDLFDAYCQRCAPVPLPNVVGGLSLLVAKGILHERT